MIKNKKAEGYVRTSIMILIFCIAIAVFMSFLTAVNIVRISKRNTYKIIDGYVTAKSIEEFNSIKTGTDYTEQIDNDTFTDYFCEYNSLTRNGNILIARTESGYEKYRITNLNLSFIQDNTLKLQVDYIITIPVSFGDFEVFNAEVPITIKSKYTDKFS